MCIRDSAIAEAAAAAGARVVLVSGPVALAAPAGVGVVPVKTARDMLAAAASVFPAADAAIFAAAVADLRLSLIHILGRYHPDIVAAEVESAS